MKKLSNILENSLYGDDKEKSALLSDLDKLKSAFFFNVLGIIAMVAIDSEDAKLQRYIRTAGRLQVTSVDDSNADFSLITKLLVDAGILGSSVAGQWTRLFAAIKSGKVNSENITTGPIFELLVKSQWLSKLKPEAKIKSALNDLETTKDWGDFLIRLHKVARLGDNLTISEEFRVLVKMSKFLAKAKRYTAVLNSDAAYEDEFTGDNAGNAKSGYMLVQPRPSRDPNALIEAYIKKSIETNTASLLADELIKEVTVAEIESYFVNTPKLPDINVSDSGSYNGVLLAIRKYLTPLASTALTASLFDLVESKTFSNAAAKIQFLLEKIGVKFLRYSTANKKAYDHYVNDYLSVYDPYVNALIPSIAKATPDMWADIVKAKSSDLVIIQEKLNLIRAAVGAGLISDNNVSDTLDVFQSTKDFKLEFGTWLLYALAGRGSPIHFATGLRSFDPTNADPVTVLEPLKRTFGVTDEVAVIALVSLNLVDKFKFVKPGDIDFINAINKLSIYLNSPYIKDDYQTWIKTAIDLELNATNFTVSKLNENPTKRNTFLAECMSISSAGDAARFRSIDFVFDVIAQFDVAGIPLDSSSAEYRPTTFRYIFENVKPNLIHDSWLQKFIDHGGSPSNLTRVEEPTLVDKFVKKLKEIPLTSKRCFMDPRSYSKNMEAPLPDLYKKVLVAVGEDKVIAGMESNVNTDYAYPDVIVDCFNELKFTKAIEWIDKNCEDFEQYHRGFITYMLLVNRYSDKIYTDENIDAIVNYHSGNATQKSIDIVNGIRYKAYGSIRDDKKSGKITTKLLQSAAKQGVYLGDMSIGFSKIDALTVAEYVQSCAKLPTVPRHELAALISNIEWAYSSDRIKTELDYDSRLKLVKTVSELLDVAEQNGISNQLMFSNSSSSNRYTVADSVLYDVGVETVELEKWDKLKELLNSTFTSEACQKGFQKILKKSISDGVSSNSYYDEIKGNKLIPVPNLNAGKIAGLLKLNDITVAKPKTSSNIDKYIENIKTFKSSGAGKLPEIKAVDIPLTADEKYDIMLELKKTRTGRHGAVSYPLILRKFTVVLPTTEFDKFKASHPGTTEMNPVFHGTSSIAANMILRKGFAVADQNKMSKVGVATAGRMLGDGTYFADSFDKASQYCGDGYSRGRRKGYMFRMKALLGNQGTDYESAGLGRDTIRSPEWCVFNPGAQLAIYECYELEVVEPDDWSTEMKRLKPGAVITEDKSMNFKQLHEAKRATQFSTYSFEYIDELFINGRRRNTGSLVAQNGAEITCDMTSLVVEYPGKGEAVRLSKSQSIAFFESPKGKAFIKKYMK